MDFKNVHQIFETQIKRLMHIVLRYEHILFTSLQLDEVEHSVEFENQFRCVPIVQFYELIQIVKRKICRNFTLAQR